MLHMTSATLCLKRMYVILYKNTQNVLKNENTHPKNSSSKIVYESGCIQKRKHFHKKIYPLIHDTLSTTYCNETRNAIWHKYLD